MMNMNIAKITIEPQSYLLCASGEGRANVDAEVVFDNFGFPIFPGRRLKGLLRESMIEVLEMMGKSPVRIEEKIIQFFGQEGSKSNEGWLKVNTLKPEDYDHAVAHIAQKSNLAFSRYNLQRYFVCQVQQTSINSDDGVARDSSLRTYHVLNYKHVPVFSGKLECSQPLSTEDEKLLNRTCQNFRYAGTRRNRGFGKLKCTLNDFEKVSTQNEQSASSTGVNALTVTIDCLENVVLSTLKGEQNTVYTEDSVSGNRLRGMLAQLYLQQYGVDKDFKNLFLRSNLTFGNCAINGATPIPFSLQSEKYNSDTIVHNMLNTPSDDVVIPLTKSIHGYVNKIGQLKVKKNYQFHNSRPDRSAGRSVEDQASGGIFYYESIAAKTRFIGKISGASEWLQLLINKIGMERETNIGKSKSAQYGNVKIAFTPANTEAKAIKKESFLYLVATTPLILFNNVGFPTPNLKTFQSYLPDGIKIIDAKTRTTTVEQFNTQWASKSGKVVAFAAGSCFKVQNDQAENLDAIGEWQEQGFGKIEIYTEQEMNGLKDQLQTDDKLSSITMTPPTDKQPAIIENIEKLYNNQRRAYDLKILAYNDSLSLKGEEISNSLIGRMNAILENNEEQIKNDLKHIKSTPAGKVLEQFFLLDDLRKTRLLEGKYRDFEEYLIYWRSYFDSLRLHNKNQ